MSYTLLHRDDLPRDGNTYEFEGGQYPATDTSFIWVEMPPGDGVRLHQHAYTEVFIVQEGTATFTVGNDTLEAGTGHIVIVPGGLPHKFVNTGQGTLKQIDLHLTKTILTEWLE